jgi:PilZ domain
VIAKADQLAAAKGIDVLERRAKPRVSGAFRTTVSGIDVAGAYFELDCVLDNISATGLYLRIPRELKQGSELRLLVNFSSGLSGGASAVIRGVVLRNDPDGPTGRGLAVAITDYKF